MRPRIAIVGAGKAGTALHIGLSSAGYEVRFAPKGLLAPTTAWADVIVIAVPFGAVRDVAHSMRATVNNKPVIDVTNPLTHDIRLAMGFTTSGAEELQKLLPRAHVVKAFNTVLAQHMSTGQINGQQLTAFAASDDDTAREAVLDLARAIGFDAVCAGELRNARSLEALAFLNIQLSRVLKNGPDVGFKFVH